MDRRSRTLIVSSEMKKFLVLIAFGLLAFGPLALLAPETAASAYGIRADSPETRAYLFAAAVRDVALGCWLLALLGLGATRQMLAASVFAIAIVAAGDAANVLAHTGWRSSTALVVHAGGFFALVAVGIWVLKARVDGEK
jgi:hypothetical protein